jgi:hypothetical protein
MQQPGQEMHAHLTAFQVNLQDSLIQSGYKHFTAVCTLDDIYIVCACPQHIRYHP